MSEIRYTIVVQSADGRERTLRVSASNENQACDRALRDAKRQTPIDSRGKASEWRVLHVR